ncbi:GH32 C-terminal domain-containing protein [Saccharothrix sp.]|uniref:GH32 C-terminal domain-containing protein n=1 Tax=Saccharothrix sp. TaxID=1873460 RepID=UPI0028116298|nr:GH32 C-terminal domain-containing protein [Saccharothrix sp.]
MRVIALLPGTVRVIALLVAAVVGLAPTAAAQPSFDEPYRPQFHFTPERNWMNDPNGLVYHEGEYHLFYQYNPNGNTWGDMSWGHAVSPDLVRWRELPLAIPHDDTEMVFSGSAVVDHGNTTGFGTAEDPAMVAIYTSHYKADGRQAQSLAYSTDNGRTWTKYAGNPVLDIGSREFRDPKVQWHDGRWLMTVSLSVDRKVRFYSSPDLKTWTHLSDFGPQGAVGGVWECPDLFPLAVDGDPNRVKWVLVVNLNPGGIAGGSAAQYFVGDFDGTRFTPDDDGSYTPPSGVVLQDFEQPGYGTWTTTGTAFGDGPVFSAQPGIEGSGYADSFHGGDPATGTLTSPEFTVSSRYLNFKVAGGRHPRVPGSSTEPPAGRVLADFEGADYGSWTVTGDAFGTRPATGTLPGQHPVSGWVGGGLVNTFLGGDATTGTLTSPGFTVDRPWLNLLVGGGHHPGRTAVDLVVDGQVVRTATGRNNEALDWVAWDVREFAGRTARLRVVDAETGGWGHVNVDHVVLSDAPAAPWSVETTVDLLVDGSVVQSVTGDDSGTLDWASFDLRSYQGRRAQVRLVDRNTGGWGHLLVDHFVAADAPALSSTQRASWVDHGKDYYAAVSWEGAPDGKRHMIGWMNNWQYGGAVPTSPWRGAQSVPREMGLVSRGGRIVLTQQPVAALRSLRGAAVVRGGMTVRDGAVSVARGTSYEVDTTFALGDADRFGLEVRTGPGEKTVIGYDSGARELYVDRTRSGQVGFSADFPGVQRVRLEPVDGRVRLRVLVDRSSVEVFGGAGEAVITDQVFPSAGSDGVRVFAEGGAARVAKFQLWPLRSYRR